MAASAPSAARRTSSGSETSPLTTSTPISDSATASSGLRTNARTLSPRWISCSQTLAPVWPVAPVTKMVLDMAEVPFSDITYATLTVKKVTRQLAFVLQSEHDYRSLKNPPDRPCRGGHRRRRRHRPRWGGRPEGLRRLRL